MKKILTFCSVILVCSLLLLSCSATATTTTTTVATTTAPGSTTVATTATTAKQTTAANLPPIKIGVVTFMTGFNANVGESIKNAWQILADNQNAKGGIIGRKIEFIIEDAGETDQGCINAHKKLGARGDIDFIYQNTWSSGTLATASTIKANGIPVITPNSTLAISELKLPNLFMTRLNDSYQSQIIVNAAVEKFNVKKPALVFGTDAYGQGLQKYAIQFLKEKGITPAIIVNYNLEDKQLTPILSQVANSGCDGVIAPGQPNDLATIMLQLKALGVNVPRFGSSSGTTASTLRLAGEAATGWLCATEFMENMPTQKGKAFIAEYKTRFNKSPEMYTAFSYDCFVCIVAAIEKAGSTDRAAVIKAMNEIKDVEGISATYTGNGQYSMANSMYLAEIKSGGNVEIIDTIKR